jgi:stage II sporulation protein AA (anti-sigma F factor antagonist)
MDEPHRSSGPDVDERGIKPPPAFAMEEVPARPGTLLLRLVGELDLAASGGFRDRVEKALAAGERNVVLDMTEARFIDSSMLKELLRANTATRDAGGRLVLTDVQPAVERLLELTRVREILDFAASRDEALRRASGGPAPG